MSKKFINALRPDIRVRRTGFLGLGRKIEVSEGGDTNHPVTYRIERRGSNEETAAAINSRIPVATFRRPL